MSQTISYIFLFLLVAACRVASPAPFVPEDGFKPPELRLVFPQNGDTLNYKQVRYAGSTAPGATVHVQGREARVYASGGFVGLIDLKPGVNLIPVRAEARGATSHDTLRIFRDPESVSYPRRPTAVHSSSIIPRRDVFVQAGEKLLVEFRGSPGGRASCLIAGVTDHVRLKEMSARKTGGLAGVYRALVSVPESASLRPAVVQLMLHGRDGRAVRFSARGRVQVFSPNQPRLATTVDSSTFVLGKPGGKPLLVLPAGLPVRVVSAHERLDQVRLSNELTGYIDKDQLSYLSANTPHPYATVGNISSQADDDWLHLDMDVSEQVPFGIEQSVKPAELKLSFYRAVRSPKWVTMPPQDSLVERIQTRQRDGDTFTIGIKLNQKQQWGYSGKYQDGRFRLSVRRAPEQSTEMGQPLSGLKICVDAGHGGEQEGTTGATAMLEKDANLKVALMVEKFLVQRGAEVVMTRSGDETLSLQERVALARREGTQLFLSIHHNSINPNVDPLEPRGASTYFTTSQSELPAKLIFERLQDTGLKSFASTTAPFMVTRQTDFVSVLVECAFLTHPEDELLLLNGSFVREMAGAIVAGVVDFAGRGN